jgi:hypothetical protein
MAHAFEGSLSTLMGTRVSVSPDDILRDAGQAPVLVSFSTGASSKRAGRLSAASTMQQYGLPAPINAIEMLHDVLAGKGVSSAYFDHRIQRSSISNLFARYQPRSLLLDNVRKCQVPGRQLALPKRHEDHAHKIDLANHCAVRIRIREIKFSPHYGNVMRPSPARQKSFVILGTS